MRTISPGSSNAREGAVGSRVAVFLDRDGTLNVRAPEHQYIESVDAFRWLPAAKEAVASLSRAGFMLAVTSNQRGVARGMVSHDTLKSIESRIQRDLRAYACRIEVFRYCEHDLDDDCACRKPRPGMLLDLAREHELDLAHCWMVGDAESDVLAGRAAGCRTGRIRSGPEKTDADVAGASLRDVSKLILEATTAKPTTNASRRVPKACERASLES